MNVVIRLSLTTKLSITLSVGSYTLGQLYVLHSECIPHIISRHSLGVPYHSWRITHGKHHASTGHMTLDQVFVPSTRSNRNLPAFDPAKEDVYGASVTEEVKKELWEALGDSPIGATLGVASYFVSGRYDSDFTSSSADN